MNSILKISAFCAAVTGAGLNIAFAQCYTVFGIVRTM